MKNVLAGAVAATLLSSGLIAGTAYADEVPPCPTDGCNHPPTVVAVGIGKPAGKKSLVKASVSSVSSNTVAEGQLLLKVYRIERTADEKTLKRVAVRTEDLDENGKVRFHVRLRQPGKYKFGVKYTQPADQGGGYGIGFGGFRVKKK